VRTVGLVVSPLPLCSVWETQKRAQPSGCQQPENVTTGITSSHLCHEPASPPSASILHDFTVLNVWPAFPFRHFFRTSHACAAMFPTLARVALASAAASAGTHGGVSGPKHTGRSGETKPRPPPPCLVRAGGGKGRALRDATAWRWESEGLEVL